MGLLIGSLAVLAFQHQRRPDPTFADPGYRAARAAGAALSPEEWAVSKEQEDRALANLGLDDDEAVRDWVGDRAEEITPAEDELRAVWESERAVFGTRSFEQSRDVLVRIARLRRIRAELETAAR